MAEEKKSYKAISDEVRQLAQQVEGVALSGAAALSGGKRRRRKSSGAAPKRRKSSRKGSRKGSKKRRGSRKSKKGMAAFGSQLINLGLKMQSMQTVDGGKKKKAKVATRQVMGSLI
jgi:hypothetical protein